MSIAQFTKNELEPNGWTILHFLHKNRDECHMTRHYLHTQLRLPMTTLHDNLEQLIRKNLVQKKRADPKGRGCPPWIYRINPKVVFKIPKKKISIPRVMIPLSIQG